MVAGAWADGLNACEMSAVISRPAVIKNSERAVEQPHRIQCASLCNCRLAVVKTKEKVVGPMEEIMISTCTGVSSLWFVQCGEHLLS